MSVQSEINRLKNNVAAAFTAIGNKGGTVPTSKVSGNLATSINSIPAGVTVKRKTGTFTTNKSGTATVDVGFQPDVVYIKGESYMDDGETYSYSQAIVFSEENRTNPNTSMWYEDGLLDVYWERTTSGFMVYAYIWDYDWTESTANRKSFTYVAIKYT